MPLHISGSAVSPQPVDTGVTRQRLFSGEPVKDSHVAIDRYAVAAGASFKFDVRRQFDDLASGSRRRGNVSDPVHQRAAAGVRFRHLAARRPGDAVDGQGRVVPAGRNPRPREARSRRRRQPSAADRDRLAARAGLQDQGFAQACVARDPADPQHGGFQGRHGDLSAGRRGADRPSRGRRDLRLRHERSWHRSLGRPAYRSARRRSGLFPRPRAACAAGRGRRRIPFLATQRAGHVQDHLGRPAQCQHLGGHRARYRGPPAAARTQGALGL